MAKRKAKKVGQKSTPRTGARGVQKPPVSAQELDSVLRNPFTSAGALLGAGDVPEPRKLKSKAPVRWPQSAKRPSAPPRAQPPSKGSALTRVHAPDQAYPAPSNELTSVQIYETLAALLVPYARKMESEMHPKIGFCLKARSPKTGREVHFGGVQALPDGVAFHLFPLYAHPDLLEHISPELHQHLRSQTQFQFDSLHAGLVAELAELTHAGFERFVADGQV